MENHTLWITTVSLVRYLEWVNELHLSLLHEDVVHCSSQYPLKIGVVAVAVAVAAVDDDEVMVKCSIIWIACSMIIIEMCAGIG
uniref:Uncharacterized protein n=1 Tax=Glossina austeni TaxID=7395 RepID=A0A1A9UF44_GLOAU